MPTNKFATAIYRWLETDRMAWLSQAKLRDSFMSKALTSLSLATFALGNLAPLLSHLGVHIWKLQCLFIGAVLFLVGYLVVTFRIPPEFRGAIKLNET
jgi:predicted membrane channel-forming protein YqfA (hemolysin III family)